MKDLSCAGSFCSDTASPILHGQQSLLFGLYDPFCPPQLSDFTTWEKNAGVRISIISWYQAWGAGSSGCQPELIREAHQRGQLPLITWEPWQWPENLPVGSNPWEQPEYSLKNLVAGGYEEHVRAWGRALAETDVPVLLRPMHEMNGNWYPWAGMVNHNQPADFLPAWSYLRRLFSEEGAKKVEWVWCPYVLSVPDTTENALERYFPGEDQVDWLGLDGYNWGTSRSWSSWQSFAQIFGNAYQRVHRLAPHKPIIIAEVGCSEMGGDKAAWIREALSCIRQDFPAVRGLVWFNIAKECDWRLESSPTAWQAFRDLRNVFN